LILEKIWKRDHISENTGSLFSYLR
jgi:hypothetical protein